MNFARTGTGALFIARLVVAIYQIMPSSAYPVIQTPRQPFVNDAAYPGVLNYVDPSVDVAHVRRAANGDDARVEATWNSVELLIKNARLRGSDTSRPLCTLDREGCELIHSPVAIVAAVDDDDDDDRTIDFLNTANVMDDYYPQCEALLRKRLGPKCVQVVAFDHNVRMTEPPVRELAHGGGAAVQAPLGFVHGDYTATSAPRRIQDLAKPPKQNDVWRERLPVGTALLDAQVAAEAVGGKRRFALINVWRSIDEENPVTSYPLAFANAQTVKSRHLRTLQVHYSDRIGENYLATPHETHEWLFYPHMTFDEALLIKQWDSAGDLAMNREIDEDNDAPQQQPPLSTFAIHSAFGLPSDCTPTSASTPRPRKSIEVRCICIWETECLD